MSSDGADLTSMAAGSRHTWLLQRTRERGFARVRDLAAELGVSGMTVRRDLTTLQERGLVQRVRGGAVPSSTTVVNPGTLPSVPIAVPREGEGQHRQVGVLIPAVGYYYGANNEKLPQRPPEVGYYFEQVLTGLRAGLEPHHLRPRLMFSRGRTSEDSAATDAALLEEERQNIDELVAAGVEGILFTPNGGTEVMETYLSWLRDLPVPVVLLERDIGSNIAAPTISSVRSAHEVGVGMALEHLRAHGHESVGLLVHYRSQTATSIERGWRHATAAMGIDARHVSRVAELPQWPSTEGVDGYLRQLIGAGVTALLAHNDSNTFIILQRLQSLGVQVPRDFSLISYDDDFAGLFDPPVTAVSTPRLFVGRLAASLLRDSIEDASASCAHIRVEPHLTTRASVAAAPGRRAALK
jgi:DNA-binding LacI/PurR family transcriptional regulator